MGVLNTAKDLRYSIKFQRQFRFWVDFSCFIVAFIFSLAIVPFYVEKSEADTEIDPTVGSTLTFVSTSDIASVAITPTTSGTFAASSSSNDIKFSISTNNYTGYSLSVRSNKTTLSNDSASINSLASSVTSSQFQAAGNTQYNNRWGYRPSYYNSSSNTNFLAAPTTTAVLLDRTTTANSTAKNYSISLGARVDLSLPSGTYVNDVFILEYVANAVPYSIYFNNNADGDVVTSMPNTISGESISATTVPLPISIPSRNNYTFAGWCTVRPTEGAGGQTCSGTLYDAGSIFAMNYTTSNAGIMLYATWTSNHGCNKAATTINTGVTATDAVCMQDINSAVISTMTVGTQYTLKDMRDDKTYFIAKLIDDKVWMTQNLNYNLDSTVTLTHDNTDLGYTTNEPNTTWTPSADTLTDLNNWVNNASSAVSYDHSAWYYPSSGSTSTDTGTMICDDATTCKHYNAGTFYNAVAAIAENITGSSFDYTSMPDSVCPAGWRLYRGYTRDTYSEINTLAYLYNYVEKYVSSGNTNILSGGLDGLRSAPVYFVRAGSVSGGTQSNAGANGRFHSSVLISDTMANMTSFSSTIMYPLNYTDYSTGASVRCVARMSTGTTTVNFYGNGAISGTTKTIVAESGTAVNLQQSSNFYKASYKLVKWNTKADGTGTDYELSSTVRVSPNTTTTVDLYAVWQPAYEIVYNGNNATSDAPMNVNHIVLNDDVITLYAPNYLRTGYGFAGWSTTQINPDASNAAALMAAAKIFGPNETITVNYDTFGVNVPSSITLYAVWVKSSGSIQDWKGCNSLTAATYSNNTITPGSVIALTDSRDGNTYAIAKLTDGNCWMIENLRLDAANSSDVSKAQGFSGVFNGLANSEDNFSASSFYANSKYNDSNIVGDNQVYRIPRYNNNNTNYGGTNSNGTSLETSATNNNNKSQWYGYGNYYNWPAAKANTEDLIDSDTSKGYFTSICPSGWMLPFSGSSSTEDYTYRKLSYSLSGSTLTSFNASSTPTGETMSKIWRSYPSNFIYSGYYSGTTTYYRNTRGYYWVYNTNYTSTASASYFYDNQLTITGGLNKHNGMAVRCVADNSYRLRYDGNMADSGSDMIMAQPAVASSEITLYASNYKRSGYGFLGWSFTQIDPDASGFTSQIASATIYGPNQTITLPSTVNGDLTLYAVWIKSAGDIQNWAGCSSLAQGGVTALKDTRDNQVYAVAKLADGNCWMIENLRLNDNHSTDYEKMQGVGGVYNGLSESTTNFSVSTVDTPLYTINPRTTTKSFISGDYQQYRFPKYNNDNTLNSVSHMVANTQNVYSYGNYYSFAAAMANTSIMITSNVSENTGSSLCPAGWVLPTAGSATSGKQFNVLKTVLDTSAKAREYPNNFVYSGSAQNSSITGRGTNSTYVSRSINDNDAATYYYFHIVDSSSQHMYEVASYAQKYWGHSIRCIRATSIPITLSANDGSGRQEIVYGEAGSSMTLPIVAAFMKDDMVVTSWNTSPDGTGTSYTTSYTPQSATTLYAQWTPAYLIQYDGNGETTTSNMALYAHSGIASGAKVLLYDNNVLRDGYGFVGWSTTQIDPDASNAATLIKNAKILGPNETITANATNLGTTAPATVTLYAVWIKSSGNMQNWNGCDSLTTTTYSNGVITPGDVIGLTDTRDNKVYAISKLSDGQCWMMEALHLNSRNSNISLSTTNYPTNEYLTKMSAGSEGWCSTNSSDCVDRILSSNTNATASTYYYNWYTITAGNGNYAMTSGTAAGDICPAGWHASRAGTDSSSDYYRLAVSLGGNYAAMSGTIATDVSARLRTYPNNFRYYGFGLPNGNKADPYNNRKSGYYIGTNPSTSVNAAMFYMTDSSVYISSYPKYYGYPVICIKNPKAVRYDGNGADEGNIMRVTHPATPSSTINLYASNYKRDGYGFLGWSFTQIDPDASNAATLIANATIYGPNETITLPSTINGDLVLYAVWIKSAGNLQSWSGCSSLTQGSVTALKDTRDNQVYAVGKLADGNCWMLENLRLSDEYSYDATKSQGYGGVFNGLAESELATFFYSNLPNSLYSVGIDSDGDYKISGEFTEYRVPRYNNANTSATVSVMTSSNQNIYSYGNYYNFAAASANTSTILPAGDNAGTSICPLGWRLPTGGDGKEFSSLMSAVSGATNLRMYPNNFIFSGYLWQYNINGRGTYGEFYSSTSTNETGANDFQFYNASNYQHRNVNKALGTTIRCISTNGQFAVTLNSNDGNNRLAHIYGASGSSISLPNDTFYRNGYKILSWNTQANGSGTSYTSTYSITGNQTLYAQWGNAYNIKYDGNNDDLGTDMEVFAHENVGTGDEVMLYANNYIRDGYGFLGWSITQINPDASNASTLISNAKIFGPNQTITANATNLGVSAPATVTLYAVWLKSSGTFQNWKGCDSLSSTNYSNGSITPGSYIALTDNRGSTANTYAIAKLSDGKCWMIEDARFNVKNDNITSVNTNFPTSDFLTDRTGTVNYNCTTNTQECVNSIFYSNGNNQSRGVYYNWHTGTAGYAHFGSATAVEGDICPAGWKIPIGNTGYDYGDLFVSIGAGRSNYDTTTTPTADSISRTLRSFPYNFIYNGNILGTTYYSYRTIGYYMASNGFINAPTNYMHYLSFSNSVARLSYGTQSQYGVRIRCVYSPTIIYDGNGATSGSSTGGMRISGSTVTLATQNFKKTGYGFVGWSANSNGTGTIYGPNETINVSEISANADAVGNIRLYAVWVPVSGNIQNWNGCNSLSIPSVGVATSSFANVTALTDTRDGEVYAVARYADGNCYMINDLRLGDSELLGNLTSSNTNLSDQINTEVFNGWITRDYSATYTDGVVLPLKFNYNKPGVMYNFCAASAGTVCNNTESVSATYDICPAGWRLPYGGSGNAGGDYYALGAFYGYNTSDLARKSAVNGGLGMMLSTSTIVQYNSAAITTSTTLSTTSTYGVSTNLNSFTWNSSFSKNTPNGIRCVFNKPTSVIRIIYGSGVASVTVGGASVPNYGYIRLEQGVSVPIVMYLKPDYAFSSWSTNTGTIGVSAQTSTYTPGTSDGQITAYATFTGTYMQNLAASQCTTTASRVYDSRDMQSYYIKRLSDGKCWMMDNLNLGAVSFYLNLTSSNSNLASTITYSTFNGWKKTTSDVYYDSGQILESSGTDSTSNTKYGMLYNYYAITGGTISGDSNSTNATYDICPAGWRLPTGGSSGELATLYSYYNTYNSLRAPYSNGGAAFNQPGYFGNGSADVVNKGYSGSFWSSTTYNSTYRYSLYVDSSPKIQETAGSIRYAGHSARCVLDPKNVLTVSYGTGVSSVTVNGVTVANGGTISLASGSSVPIVMYLKAGYSFSSWSATSGTVGASAQTSTYTIGSSNATLTANAVFTGTYIQNLSSSSCTSTARQVFDSRDMTMYYVKRLDDGRCWMMNNLELGKNAISTNLTSSNTNINTSISYSTFNSWRKTNSISGSISSGEMVPQIGSDSTSGNNYGVLYNFYAATGGNASASSGNTSYDICPAGWRMPIGASDATNEYRKLYNKYNSVALMHASMNNGGAAFPYSGMLNTSSIINQGIYGYFWSSTNYDSSYGVMLMVASSSQGVSTFSPVDKMNAMGVRCIMKETNIGSLSYLQDFYSLSSANKTAVINSMASNTVYTLVDNRDNQSYQVAKLADNNVYMIDNLNLGSSSYPFTTTSFSSINTNIPNSGTYYNATGFYNERKTANFSSFTEAGYVEISNAYDSTSQTNGGIVYNYCAASLYEICVQQNTANATQDICPAGWRMPTGGASGEFLTLVNAYSANINLVHYPVTSGGAGFADTIDSADPRLGPFSITSDGIYWSSTREDNTAMNMMNFTMTTNSVWGNNWRDRYGGAAIRCRLK
ncbi:InlB B-repeat-containing protein [Candidatus Saccharibacteria bacterium]|nr:InlB B-repeat-containing protein [Candidatus Saccharibacteria bacterium]